MIWSALSYYPQPLLFTLAERLVVLPAVVPWLLLLELAAGKATWRARVLRGVLALLLVDRMIADVLIWVPISAILAGVWAAGAASQRQKADPRRPRHLPPFLWVFAGFGLAGLASNFGRMPSVLYLGLVFIAASCYWRWDLASQGRLSSRTPFAVVYALAAASLLAAVKGLSASSFIPLLVGGVVGWTGLQFAIWRRRQMAYGRAKVHQRIALVACGCMSGLLSALLLGEIYYRHIYDASDSNGELRTSLHWAERHIKADSRRHRLRGPRLPDHSTEDVRILILGDSFAYGWGIPDDEGLLGVQLEKELQQRFLPRARVFTTASGGINTVRERELFESDSPQIQPHVVVLTYHLNDLDLPDAREPHPGPYYRMWQPLTDSSDFAQFWMWRLFRSRAFPATPSSSPVIMGYQDERVFTRQAGHVRDLLRSIRSAGAETVAVVYPFLDMPVDSGPQRVALDRVSDLFAAERVPVLDVSRVVNVNDRKYRANWFDPHPSAELHRETVPLLAEKVMGVLKVKAGSRPGTMPSGQRVTSMPAATLSGP